MTPGAGLSPLEELMALFDRPAWLKDAACKEHDPGLWFPSTGQGSGRAIEACERCLVRSECLDYAMGDPSLKGVWGGTSAQQRAKLRRRTA